MSSVLLILSKTVAETCLAFFVYYFFCVNSHMTNLSCVAKFVIIILNIGSNYPISVLGKTTCILTILKHMNCTFTYNNNE